MKEKFSNEIMRFFEQFGCGVCVTDEATKTVLFADALIQEYFGKDLVGKPTSVVFQGKETPCAAYPQLRANGKSVEWEMLRSDGSRQMFKVRSACVREDGRRMGIHQFSDISSYIDLSSEIVSYMVLFRQLAAFQSDVMRHLADTFPDLVPLLMNYFDSDRILLLWRRAEFEDVTCYCYGKREEDAILMLPRNALSSLFAQKSDLHLAIETLPETARTLLAREGEVSVITGEASGDRYALVLANMRGALRNETLLNVVSLYIENGIMREKIIWESEHDGLTGLYNRSKYLADYRAIDRVGVLYFDLNNLKETNDAQGHDAGDTLLRRAGACIASITPEGARAYRMGGDEFLLVVPDGTPALLDELQAHFGELTANGMPVCSVAVGAAFGEYEPLDAVIARADLAMYQDKRRIKKKNR